MTKNKMKKVLLIFGSCLSLFLAFYFGKLYGNEDAFPGSNEDPLITKSYLDERLSGKIGGGTFLKVSLAKNKTLFLHEGAEFVIYKGSGKVKGSVGLINTSKGILFESGDTLVKYQVFLAPSENCGIIANDKMTLFISGGYSIK